MASSHQPPTRFLPLFLLLLAGLCNSLPAQQGLGGTFEWISPALSAETFWNVRLAGDRIEIAASDRLLVSLDNGASWHQEPRDSVGMALSRYASWLDASNGWALAGALTASPERNIYRTFDGGATWSLISTLAEGVIPRYIVFSDAMHGGIFGMDGAMLRSSDGGVTWEPLPPITTGDFYHASLTILDDNSLLAPIPLNHSPGGAVSGVFLSNDNGTTWDTLDFVEPVQGVNGKPLLLAVYPVAGETILATTSEPKLYKSTDGGRTWTYKPTGLVSKLDPTQEPLITGITFVDDNTGIGLGSCDEIFRTTDAGESWQLIDTGIAPTVIDGPFGKTLIATGNLFGAVATGGQRLLLYGAGGILRSSTDGGLTWRALNDPITPNFLSTVDFSSKMAGWIAGAGGALYRTIDGGVTWKPSSTGTTQSIADLVALDSLTAIAALVPDGIARTDDGGMTWEIHTIDGIHIDTIETPERTFNDGVRALYFVDHDNGYVVGAGGSLLKSTNGGQTWTAIDELRNGDQSPYTFTLNGLFFVDADHGWVVGNAGAIFATSDGGATWNKQPTADASTYALRAVSFEDGDNGAAVGDNGHYYYTTNGGATWEAAVTQPDQNLEGSGMRSMTRATDGTLWATGIGVEGLGGTVARSDDGGRSWSRSLQVVANDIGFLDGVSFTTPEQGWFVGSRGSVLKFTAATSSVVETETGSRALRILPNPFVGNVSIDLLLQRDSDIQLSIVDAQGRSRRMLHSGYMARGAHRIALDAAELPVGVYYLRLVAEGKVEVLPIVHVE